MMYSLNRVKAEALIIVRGLFTVNKDPASPKSAGQGSVLKYASCGIVTDAVFLLDK